VKKTRFCGTCLTAVNVVGEKPGAVGPRQAPPVDGPLGLFHWGAGLRQLRLRSQKGAGMFRNGSQGGAPTVISIVKLRRNIRNFNRLEIRVAKLEHGRRLAQP